MNLLKCILILCITISSQCIAKEYNQDTIKELLSNKLQSFSDKYCKEDNELSNSDLIKEKCSKIKLQKELIKPSHNETNVEKKSKSENIQE
jgi:hypothetical protein